MLADNLNSVAMSIECMTDWMNICSESLINGTLSRDEVGTLRDMASDLTDLLSLMVLHWDIVGQEKNTQPINGVS